VGEGCMANVLRGFVEGIGVVDIIPQCPEYFNQIIIYDTVQIPEEKPYMKQLLSVMVEANVISIRIVNTPVGFSNEGQNLEGKKLIVQLNLRESIKYASDDAGEIIHVVNVEYNKNIFVVVPKFKYADSVENLLKKNRVIVKPYVQDICGKMIDNRTIFKNIDLLVDVTFIKEGNNQFKF
jgi:hypothetical protein